MMENGQNDCEDKQNLDEKYEKQSIRHTQAVFVIFWVKFCILDEFPMQ